MLHRPVVLALAATAAFLAVGGCASDDADARLRASTAPGLGGTIAPAAFDDDEPGIEDLAQLTVRGTAEIDVPADEVRLSIGVVSEGEDAEDVLRENTRKVRAVLAALGRLGLTDEEYDTGRFDVRPQYSRRPRGAEDDWRPRIIGFQVQNVLTVTTTRLDLAGPVIAAANEAGANTVQVLGFGLAEPDAQRERAIREATRSALRDAKAMADAAGVELVRILRIRLDDANTPRGPIASPMMEASARMAMDAAPPIDAGDVTVRASVTTVHEIRPARVEIPPE